MGKQVIQETVDKYTCTKNKAAEYIRHQYGQTDISIHQVDYDFVSNYQIYLLSQGGCGHNTLMLTKGVSVETVSKILGHTDIKTTQIYAKILHEKVDKEMAQVREELYLVYRTVLNSAFVLMGSLYSFSYHLCTR